MKIVNTAKAKSNKTTPSKTKRETAAPATPKTKTVAAAKPVKATAAPVKRAIKPAPAPQITSEQIARRAYSIWEQQGRPAGKESEHWLLAEQQLKSSQSFTE